MNTTPPTPPQVDAEMLGVLLAKATPGPWSSGDSMDGCCFGCTVDGCHESHPTGIYVLHGPEHDNEDCSAYGLAFKNENDAALIAAMHEALPALLAERAALIGERDALRDALHAEYRISDELRTQAASLRQRAEGAEAKLAALKPAGFMDPEASFMLPQPNDCVMSAQVVLTREARGKYTMPLLAAIDAADPGRDEGEG